MDGMWILSLEREGKIGTLYIFSIKTIVFEYYLQIFIDS